MRAEKTIQLLGNFKLEFQMKVLDFCIFPQMFWILPEHLRKKKRTKNDFSIFATFGRLKLFDMAAMRQR